jgi:hypothetical protein
MKKAVPMDKDKLNNKLHAVKSKLAFAKGKLLERWNQLSLLHRRIFKGCVCFLVIITLFMMTLSHFMNRPSSHQNPIAITKAQVGNSTSDVKEPAPEIDLAPKTKIVESDDLKAKNEALEKKNEQLMAQLEKNKDGLATKEDIKNLMDQIKEKNIKSQKLANNNVNAVSAQIIALSNQFADLKEDMQKTIYNNPITVPNNDFYVASIIWVNGDQLVNLHDNAIDSNVTLNVGQSYKNWDLVSIDNHNCVIFKNNVGINKQCI